MLTFIPAKFRDFPLNFLVLPTCLWRTNLAAGQLPKWKGRKLFLIMSEDRGPGLFSSET